MINIISSYHILHINGFLIGLVILIGNPNQLKRKSKKKLQIQIYDDFYDWQTELEVALNFKSDG